MEDISRIGIILFTIKTQPPANVLKKESLVDLALPPDFCLFEDHMNGKKISKEVIYRDDCFESGDWHDVTIHGISFFQEDHQIRFDIDYIVKWPNLEKLEENFLISPATLVFQNVLSCDFHCFINLGAPIIENLSFQKIYKSDHSGTGGRQSSKLWYLQTESGLILIESSGYFLYIRSEPQKSEITEQHLSLSRRGGISFVTSRQE